MFLAVDDEPRNLQAIARTLRPLAKVETALSGDEGWAKFQQGSFDVVITDQRMPGMSGVELLSRVTECSPDVGRILVTAYADLDATVDAINSGRIHRYVKKPWDPQQMHACVKTVVDQVRLSEESRVFPEELASRNCALEHALATLRTSQTGGVDRFQELIRSLTDPEGDIRGALEQICAVTDEIRAAGASLTDARLRELGGSAFGHAQRLIRLHSELAQGHSGHRAIELSEEHLDAVVDAALSELTDATAEAGVTLSGDLASASRLPLNVERFACALRNVITNALEAMPEGGRLCVDSRREGDEAVVCVTDSGPGIPAEIRDRVFDAYVTAGRSGANGLGLSVTRKVLEEHGGRVEFEDAEGGGTVFRLCLPLDGEGA